MILITYNVLDSPWLSVELMNGEKQFISVKEAFQNAENIRKLLPPVFRKQTCWIYEFSAIQFLATIFMAAHYKEENKFEAKNNDFLEKYEHQPLLDTTLESYFQKWHDRFNLFSETFPFLQDIRLANLLNEEKKDDTYICRTNPFSPGANNRVFGAIRSTGKTGDNNYISPYRIKPNEFVYILLYTANMGLSPMPARYKNKSISNKSSIFISPTGKTLHETILLNCFQLNRSARNIVDEEDIIADCPVWEMDEPFALRKIEKDTIQNRYALLTIYFPATPILASRVLDDEGYISNIVVSKNVSDVAFKEDTMELLRDLYVPYNPWAVKQKFNDKGIKNVNSDKTKKAPEYVYKEYESSDSAWGLCISATGYIPDAPFVLTENKQYETLKIFYRMFRDKYKTSIHSCGVIEVPQDIRSLLKEENHKDALEYQRVANIAVNVFRNKLRNMIKSTSELDSSVSLFASKIEDDFFRVFLPSLKDHVQNTANCLDEKDEKKTETKTDSAINLAKKRLLRLACTSFESESDKTSNLIEFYNSENELYREIKTKGNIDV